ncbi:hypothetical protein [Amycolatopsis sp. H20-H5]|uniref:hypothetical protein n=1 Tax=Amycolatopsis sp. H20-H5 TaxID=3046309 RepID=UPI002DB5B60C|nr:hypothetical protein [Amycolatopsis sp. H20-H5]MEC3981580.1 hypothetical protein [Amycolatopsis sp. H20-H5]
MSNKGYAVGKKVFFVAAWVIGATAFAGTAAGHAQPGQQPPTPSTPAATVQLNADTAVSHGLINKYANGEPNVALAQCQSTGTAPTSATFSSPVLTFANYDRGPLIGVPANMSADAMLKPGTRSGQYPITVTCDGKPYTATFSVTTPQTKKVPSGAARAGDGSTAS